jgi:DNA-binding CsgD family transcriptional regulator
MWVVDMTVEYADGKWPFDYTIDEIEKASSEEDVLDISHEVFKSLGISNFVYLFLPRGASYYPRSSQVLYRGDTDLVIALKQRLESTCHSSEGIKCLQIRSNSHKQAVMRLDHFFEKELDEPLLNYSVIPVYAGKKHLGIFLADADHDKRLPRFQRGLQSLCQILHQKYSEVYDLTNSHNINLSPRERDVLLWIYRGKSTSVIGDICGISRHTADSYVRRIFSKLNVQDRVSLVIKVQDMGLIQEDLIQNMPDVMLG